MSRAAARQAKTAREVYDERAGRGVVLSSSEPKGVAEEAAFAYKDIESVMAASASLVRPTKRLTPVGVVKG
jgi:RNA-splicing ligase RtcB